MGSSSNDLASAGVLMRNTEGMAGRHTAAWEACAEDEFCARASDRLAASLVNPQMPHLWSSDQAGIVISHLGARILCSYHGDGNNFQRFCKPPTQWLKMAAAVDPDGGPCVPGCTSRFGWCDQLWQPCPLCEDVHCAWSDASLAKMMDAHAHKLQAWSAQGTPCSKGGGHPDRSRCHNEVVLDAAHWTRNLPGTVEAIFYQRTSSPESAAEARHLHRDFNRRYGGDSGTLTPPVPLVIYDPTDAATPFALAHQRRA